MEPIQIKVSVELNLSKATESFIASVFNGLVSSPAQAPAAQAPAAKPAAKPAAQAPAKPAEKPAAEKPADAPEVTIEDVRKALATKVANHRAEIKEKLDEFGAPSVTKLDPAKYQEMLDFLKSLS